MNVRIIVVALVVGAASSRAQVAVHRPDAEGAVRADVSLASPIWKSLQATASVSGGRVTSGPQLGGNAAFASGTLAFARGQGGAWLAAGGESVWRIQPSSATPVLASGLWRRLRGVVVELSTARRQARFDTRVTSERNVIGFDSTYTDTSGWRGYPTSRMVTDTTTVRRAGSWIETEGRTSWNRGGFALTGVMGMRPATTLLARAAWGFGEMRIPVTGPVTLQLGGGARREFIAAPGAVRRFASLSIGIDPSAIHHGDSTRGSNPVGASASAAFSLARIDSSGYQVSLRWSGATTVEISGDFNGWKPIRLEQTRPGVWQARLAITPGPHQMSVRVDGGAWRAPPGIPSITDEFAGTVGLIVVR